jgi:dihydrofolate reductase
MRLVLQEFISLDGVTQGPGSPDEDTSDGFTAGGWLVPHLDETFIEAIRSWVSRADAYLFGRRTYENFARDWPNMPDPTDPVAASLNGSPKYVASNTLVEATWAPTTILSGDINASVAALKEQTGREIQIHGSARLGRSLLYAGIVDELRLVIAPVIVGSGRRLLEPDGRPIGLTLCASSTTPAGLTLNTYVLDGQASVGTYDPTVHTFSNR